MKLRFVVPLLLTAIVVPKVAFSADEPAKYTIADEFRAGVLGFPWGTDLEQVATNFPAGVAWPAVSSGSRPPVERYYAVPDDTPILGLSRKGQQTMFGFDRSNRLIHAIFAMPYSAKAQLMSKARTLFGRPGRSSAVGLQRWISWAPVDGVAMNIIEIPHDTRPSLFVMVVWTLK